jgi:hypothetical protein
MAIQQTLEKIEIDIQNSNLGKARDRLHGLLISYPNDLSLRRKLGDISWKLQYPSMAGKYWYLEEEKTPEMKSACEAFEEQMGNDPMQILLALKFRGEIKAIENQYAGQLLLDLHKRSQEKHGKSRYLDFRNKGSEKYGLVRKKLKRESRLWIGCLVALLIGLIFIAIGLYTVIGWMF